MVPPRLRGGKSWFAFEAKSFEIEVEEAKRGLKGCIWERRKGITSWIRFGGRSLVRLLMGLEDCARATRVSSWKNLWEEDGRRYKMEKGSNQSGVFIRCSVRDYGGKSFNLIFPEGNGIVGGWRILAEKLRQLGVRSSEEIQMEEKVEKTQREEKQTTKLLPRLLKPIINPFAEVHKSEKILGEKIVCVKVEEEEVQERLEQLRRCLVGWWGSGPEQIPGVEAVRSWARIQWNIRSSLAVVNLGRGLWLFEFESKEEVDRVLMFGKRRFGTNLVHLRSWGEDLGCSNLGSSEVKAWVRVVGLPVHLWSRAVMKKIGDACGGFLAVDEETDKLGELGWARILVKLKKTEPPNTVEVALGGARFRMQLWWELSPQHTTDASAEQKRNPSSNREDDGVSRAWERVEGAEAEFAGGDVVEKQPVSSRLIQRQVPGQRSSAFLLGQMPGQFSGQNLDQKAGRMDGWAAVHPNSFPGRAAGRRLGFHSQKSLGCKPGPGTKTIFQKNKGRPAVSAQALSSSVNVETIGGSNIDVENHEGVGAETNQSQLQMESQRKEAPVDDPFLLNRFEISMPLDNSPSLSFFGRPLFQGGSSGLGVSQAIGEEVEGVLPMEIVVASEIKGGSSQEGTIVEYGQEEGIVEATPLAVEGYEKWEDSILVKFSEFLGFATEGFETQIVELMRQMVKSQNKGQRPGQTPASRCERELKKLECTINYGGQRSGKSANRDRGNFLLKLG